ncbi:MAG TPA: sorbosone dehydrogenase family protein [Thermoanaerobaculia bacterium]|nr:sorbosone dehydrogenase family protein [Thermoanaerobaculia bacterium]
MGLRSPKPKIQNPKFTAACAALLLVSALACSAGASGKPQLDRIKLPPGFAISVFSDAVPGARSLAQSPHGILYVGTMSKGKVYALVDKDKDGRADQVYTIASGLRSPNGVAWRDGALYVAEISRVLRFDAIDDHLASPPKPVVVSDAFPTDGHHGWKFIRFGPDGKLYVPVGAPCNICEPGDPYASITRIDPKQGGKPEIVERGIRNTVGFDWQPGTGVLWFTDNGRDMMGDDLPPDELNRAPKDGLHFGYPFCHGGKYPDPELGGKHPCSQFVPPAMPLGPHVAALGMRFYTGTMFPERYRGQIFIAEHGSWNRSQPIGYRVTLVRVQGDRAVSYEPFAEGWLGAGGSVSGRPVDVEVMPDGALLVSDDAAGAIYRITWSPPRQGA